MPNPQDVNKITKEISFEELVRKTVLAGAEGQEPLDINSLETTYPPGGYDAPVRLCDPLYSRNS